MKAVVVNLDVIEKDARRNERLSGLIDLELGGKAKWVLVYRTEDKRSLFVALVTAFAQKKRRTFS
jgi:hypothetical protein